MAPFVKPRRQLADMAVDVEKESHDFEMHRRDLEFVSGLNASSALSSHTMKTGSLCFPVVPRMHHNFSGNETRTIPAYRGSSILICEMLGDGGSGVQPQLITTTNDWMMMTC